MKRIQKQTFNSKFICETVMYMYSYTEFELQWLRHLRMAALIEANVTMLQGNWRNDTKNKRLTTSLFVKRLCICTVTLNLSYNGYGISGWLL